MSQHCYFLRENSLWRMHNLVPRFECCHFAKIMVISHLFKVISSWKLPEKPEKMAADFVGRDKRSSRNWERFVKSPATLVCLQLTINVQKRAKLALSAAPMHKSCFVIDKWIMKVFSKLYGLSEAFKVLRSDLRMKCSLIIMISVSQIVVCLVWGWEKTISNDWAIKSAVQTTERTIQADECR